MVQPRRVSTWPLLWMILACPLVLSMSFHQLCGMDTQSNVGLDSPQIPTLALLPEWIHRPAGHVAGIATPVPEPVHPKPKTPQRNADDSWRRPDTLLEDLGKLAGAGPAGQWATEASRLIRALGAATAGGGSDQAAAIIQRLAELNRRVPQLAVKIPDKTLARELRRAGYALGRRIDIWQQVVSLGAPPAADAAATDLDPAKLAACLAEVDAVLDDSAEGRAWRKYLLIDALKECAARQPSPNDKPTRQIARRALVRLTQTPLTPPQQQFVSSSPVAALRMELWRWAAEPIGAARLLDDIERYERTWLSDDARRLALDCQSLLASPIEARRQLADRVDMHYRNANFRLAVTEELLNRLIPEQNIEYVRVRETVLGRRVRGESLMATEIAVRMLPDPKRVRLALEVTGEIASLTTTEASPARFHNESQSYYIARKPVEIDMNGIKLWPVEVDVENRTRLRKVETSLDGVPLLGAVVKGVAKSQLEQSKPAATREVKRKVAAEVRQRVDAEVRQRLAKVVERLNQRIFDPLNSLMLDPQLIDAETTDKRFTMRLRLGGEDQLGSHTPRPQAPSDSLASVQIHQSVLHNGIQRLQLAGRTFTLPELSKHVATRLHCPAPWKTNPENDNVKITFAERNPVVIRCRDGQLVLTLSIARLSKSPRRWSHFQVRAFYRPEVNGRSAQLVREGVIHLIGSRLNIGAQIALRGIFSHTFSKKAPWNIVPERVVKEPKLKDSVITQFVIDDGWIGLALGPKPTPVHAALRRR